MPNITRHLKGHQYENDTPQLQLIYPSLDQIKLIKRDQGLSKIGLSFSIK